MGSPDQEDDRTSTELQHRRSIRRTFAVAAKPVTVREFRRFLMENKLESWFDGNGEVASQMKKYSPDDDGPIIFVNWNQAALYCNWLSKKEGIPPDQWCYQINEKWVVTAMKPKYLHLQGYRLPTEAEWEYTCRAGAKTSRSYGESSELLEKYGWYLGKSQERTHPVGMRKPNDLGLFDMHGNVWNWCQGGYVPYQVPKSGEALDDGEEDPLQVTDADRVLRGGSFVDGASILRSAHRNYDSPTARMFDYGFRVARTLALSSPGASQPEAPSAREKGK
jgi:formylglycine-generating enzyme required for sulfatase activity